MREIQRGANINRNKVCKAIATTHQSFPKRMRCTNINKLTGLTQIRTMTQLPCKHHMLLYKTPSLTKGLTILELAHKYGRKFDIQKAVCI